MFQPYILKNSSFDDPRIFCFAIETSTWAQYLKIEVPKSLKFQNKVFS